MASGGPRHRQRGGEARRETAGHQVHTGARQRREHDESLRNPAHELEERQREDVEADVVADDRVGLPERHRVPPGHPHLPPRGGVEADQDRDHHCDAERKRTELLAAWKRHLDAVSRREHGPHIAHRAHRHVQVHRQPDKGRGKRDDEQRGLARRGWWCSTRW